MQHADVVKRALRWIEIRVGPRDGELGVADVVGPVSGREVDRVPHWSHLAVRTDGAVIGQRDVVDLLLRHPLGVEPALDDLNTIEVCVLRIFDGANQEARRLTLRSLREIGTHRNTLGVARRRDVTRGCIGAREFVATEETELDSRSSRRVHLFALHGLEERFTRVLGRPDAGQARSAHVPTGRPGEDVLAPGFGCGIEGHLAVEVVFLGRGHSRVRIGRADHPELVGVGTNPIVEHEAAKKRRPHVVPDLGDARFVLFDVLSVFLRKLAQEPISEERLVLRAFYLDRVVVRFVVGKFIGRREPRVGLRVTFDLGHFDDRLPPHAERSVFLADGFAIAVGEGEHQAFRNVRVMGNREEVGAGFLTGLLKPCPKILGAVAV